MPHDIIMPALGMAQTSGRILVWHIAPGQPVNAGDTLFDVETDKTTMEVEAPTSGFLIDVTAAAGCDVPVGQVIARIADSPEDSLSDTREAREAEITAEPQTQPQPTAEPELATPPIVAPPVVAPQRLRPAEEGPILASPKARRLAAQEGLDLSRLAQLGQPQPYHAKDLALLRGLPATTVSHGHHIEAEVATDGLTDFADWAVGEGGLSNPAVILAGLAAASFGEPLTVCVETPDSNTCWYATRQLGAVTPSQDPARLKVRDLRLTTITRVANLAEPMPVLTVTRPPSGNGLAVSLDCPSGHLSPAHCLSLLANFAGRLEQPLRHLL